ncbi:MAG: hypothetical protein OEW21_17080, partial [Betaproteobacteria bacterium]|nr:hypothetical protein [Betaproteobacteria bacterium]
LQKSMVGRCIAREPANQQLSEPLFVRVHPTRFLYSLPAAIWLQSTVSGVGMRAPYTGAMRASPIIPPERVTVRQLSPN